MSIPNAPLLFIENKFYSHLWRLTPHILLKYLHQPGKWASCMCIRGIKFTPFYTIFLLDFGTFPTVKCRLRQEIKVRENRRDTRDADNTGYRRHITKTNKRKTQHNTENWKDEQHGPQRPVSNMLSQREQIQQYIKTRQKMKRIRHTGHHSWLITGFVNRLTRRVPLVEQELPTLPEHLSSPPVFSAVRVSRSLVLYVVVCIVRICFNSSRICQFWI
jgi:hypothetical protein